ncbi:MAG TPA: divergent polysaccharide deacetylase family protein [Alphaproteobacteria bacterium]|nr:divergent polysaccharide deacetylase family protein [Alphaproteobacteria bacterium]
MNGRSARKGDERRLSPLSATILVLLAFLLEVIAWLWISGPPGELPQPRVARVTIRLALPPAPPPAPPPASAAAPAPAAPVAAEAPPAPEEPPGSETPAAQPPAAPEPVPGAKPAGKAAAAPAPQLALVPAPAPGLVERNRLGPLPRIAPDGRAPWRVYARPFDKSDSRPRVAIVIGNLGLSSAATEAAIQELPGGVTLAFSPYAHGLEEYIPLARAAGHEVLLSLPMEVDESSATSAGPQALLTAVTPAENLERLSWLLSRFTGYVGATNYMGSSFSSAEEDMRPILEELKGRGLLFLDSGTSGNSATARIARQLGLPEAATERVIDTEASRDAIDQRLQAVEDEARQKGASIAVGFPYPVTIERVAAWTATLAQKGISLAPVSAMVRQRSGS